MELTARENNLEHDLQCGAEYYQTGLVYSGSVPCPGWFLLERSPPRLVAAASRKKTNPNDFRRISLPQRERVEAVRLAMSRGLPPCPGCQESRRLLKARSIAGPGSGYKSKDPPSPYPLTGACFKYLRQYV